MTDMVTLFEHPVHDGAFAAGEMPPPRPRSRRHVVDSSQVQVAQCGYHRQVSDMIGSPTGSYDDPGAVDCTDGCTF